MKKILITSVSSGAGHVRAAKAIEQYLKDDYIVKNDDLMVFSKKWFKYFYAELYLDLVNKYPKLWKFLYNLSDKPSSNLSLRIRRWIEYKCHQQFFKEIKDFSPDAIISSHFMPPEILTKFREDEKLNFKIFVTVTDFDVHYLWLNSGIDHYFVAGDLAKNKLLTYGINQNKITISGIPIMPIFFKDYDISALKEKWLINKDKKIILMMAGGAGVGNLDIIAKNILIQRNDIQLIVLAGKNQDLLKKLNVIKTEYPMNIIPIGFTNDVHELMFCCDLVITKPGGLSTSECISMKKPMLLVNPIPGQEEHNAIYLESLGVAKLSNNINDDLNHILNHLNCFNAAFEKYITYNSENIIKEKLKQFSI
jgi:processive 1,2-diacylglycerol beta-glucosyltransferase